MRLLDDFIYYWAESAPDTLNFWVFPIGAAILLFALTVSIVKFTNPFPPFNRTTHILTILVWAGAMSAAIVGGVGLYFWSAGLNNEQSYQATHLLSLIICFSAVLGAFTALANRQSNDHVKNLIVQPATYYDRTRSVYMLRNTYDRLKIVAWLIPLAAALALLPAFKKEQNRLLCVVLDNSFSMGSANPSGMIALQVGKDALVRTVSSLDKNTDFVLAYFDNRTARQTVPALVNAQTTSGLQGTVLIYNNDKSEAFTQIQNISVGQNGSPVCETIWKTYLVAQEAHQSRNYTKRVLVIITDGLENGISGSLDGFFCDQPEFEEFFQSDQVKVVKLDEIVFPNFPNESSEIFMSKVRQCGYEELDGATLNSYNDSINEVLTKVKSETSFPFWLLITYGIYALIIMFQAPKQNL